MYLNKIPVYHRILTRVNMLTFERIRVVFTSLLHLTSKTSSFTLCRVCWICFTLLRFREVFTQVCTGATATTMTMRKTLNLSNPHRLMWEVLRIKNLTVKWIFRMYTATRVEWDRFSFPLLPTTRHLMHLIKFRVGGKPIGKKWAWGCSKIPSQVFAVFWG